MAVACCLSTFQVDADNLVYSLAAIGIGHSGQGITISSPDELEGTLVQLIIRLLHPSP